MFIAYFGEGLIIGSLLGLVLRPVLDSYLIWRQAKEFERSDRDAEIKVDVLDPTTFELDQHARDLRGL